MLSLANRDRSFNDVFYSMYGNNAKNITFIVCHSCNMACSFCYEHDKSNACMSFDTARKCVDLLFEMDAKNNQYVNEKDANGIVLDFIGGEPLLEIKLIDKIMDYFLYKALTLNHRWATRFMISMSSNGTLYFNPEVQSFMHKWDGRVNIGITVDGSEESHDLCRRMKDGSPTYHLASRAFTDAMNKFNQTGTKMTFCKSNLHFLFSACSDMIERFNLRYLHGNPVFEDNWTNEDAHLYYMELKKLADWMISTNRYETTWIAFFDDFIGHSLSEDENQTYCGGSSKMLAFDVDGKIYPCVRFAPLSLGAELSSKCIVGDCDSGVYKNGFYSCLNCTTRRSESTDECWNCPISSGCASCTAWDYECSGLPIVRQTRICPMHKARVLATSYYYNTLYRLKQEQRRFNLNIPAEWAVPIVGEDEYNFLLSLST